MKKVRQELIDAKFLHVDFSGENPVYTVIDDVYLKEMEEYKEPDALHGHALEMAKWVEEELSNFDNASVKF